jgi:hypothetical protein
MIIALLFQSSLLAASALHTKLNLRQTRREMVKIKAVEYEARAIGFVVCGQRIDDSYKVAFDRSTMPA